MKTMNVYAGIVGKMRKRKMMAFFHLTFFLFYLSMVFSLKVETNKTPSLFESRSLKEIRKSHLREQHEQSLFLSSAHS
jgi:hypothetical protein